MIFLKLATGQLDRSEKMPLKREAQINYDRVTQVRSLTIGFVHWIKKFPLFKDDTGYQMTAMHLIKQFQND